MGGLRRSNEVILAKTEVTYNTDPVPTPAANAILVRNVNLSTEGLRMVDRAAVRASLGKLQRIFGGSLRRLTFECEVKGSGAAGTAPEIGPLLEACGLNEVLVASTSATYTPESDAHESVTIYFYEGGRKLQKLTGARGTVTFVLEAGGILLAQFNFVGHYTQPTDATQPVPTYNSQVPRAGLGMAVAINGVTAIIARSWQWMLNNVIALPPSLAATDGYSELIITDRDVTGQIIIETELDSVIDLDALFEAGTRFAFASGLLGSVAGNRVQITTPAASTYITDAILQEADGLRLREVPMAVDDSVPNTELSVAFT